MEGSRRQADSFFVYKSKRGDMRPRKEHLLSTWDLTRTRILSSTTIIDLAVLLPPQSTLCTRSFNRRFTRRSITPPAVPAEVKHVHRERKGGREGERERVRGGESERVRERESERETLSHPHALSPKAGASFPSSNGPETLAKRRRFPTHPKHFTSQGYLAHKKAPNPLGPYSRTMPRVLL